jgi:hypothetical protein
MAHRVVLKLTLTLRSPFLFQGLTNSILGIDASQLRDEAGRPIIPADQIRGVARAALATLAQRAPAIVPDGMIKALFGDASPKNEAGDAEQYDHPHRGALHFGDLAAEGLGKAGATFRVEIDDETGAVETGKLQIIELVAPFGQEVAFSGELVLHAARDLDPRKIETALSRAFNLIPSIGAFKSAGFGEVVSASLTSTTKPVALAAASDISELIAYEVSFDRPILVDSFRESENLFVGADVVPGAAIKGALATMLTVAGVDPERDPVWSTALSQLRISHAFPLVENGQEPADLPIPYSMVTWAGADGPIIGDLLLSEEDHFVSQEGRVASHVIDWKPSVFGMDPIASGFPQANLAPLARTHVGIDADTLTAEDAKLFTTVAKGVQGRHWRLSIDLSAVAKEQRAGLVGLIEAGLEPIGRTEARASFTRIDAAPKTASPVPGHPGLHAVTLITPALLTDPRGGDVQEQYARMIAAQTGGVLLRSFAMRQLAGGYLATRRRPYGAYYYPFVLTRPGSVFLIKGADPAKIAKIAKTGFRPISLLEAAELTWRNCPFLPENGYGEVRFNLIDHAGLAAGGVHV